VSKRDCVDFQEKLWSKHGSTRYLWTDEQVDNAIAYVLYGQGDDF
jgi:hypothetical protein